MDDSEFVEVDPTGRYGRYNDILGKGASKIVYRAFDEYEGIEVAWNQVKLYDFLQSPEDLERLYCEIHLLKTLKHKNIMKFYSSWVDTANRNINFVTEMFTSGTLRQYRLKHKRVNIRAVKQWCRQILRGLLYLHSHDPPVIHRDLKCDNIFVNGNQGEVKIGDLGLAAILKKSHAAHCVGTPEFMAPEVYEESYNELVDIYSFGMCILEMVTFEYPYSECSHPAQIYKKVSSGKKPDALYKVKDQDVRQFVDKCLASVSLRFSARELLDDPFLQIEEREYDSRPLNYSREFDEMGSLLRQPFLELNRTSSSLSNNGYGCLENPSEWGYAPVELEANGIELFEEHHEDEECEQMGISIKGKRRDDDSMFLRLRISDKEGRIRNIYFPFDIENDTAISVAAEMVAELDITDQDVTRIADMIDGEIASLVPDWQTGPGLVETPPRPVDQSLCRNCSGGSFMEFLSDSKKDLQCCRQGCASTHGRFEEVTYQEHWGQHESRELSSVGSGQTHYSDEEQYEKLDPDKEEDEEEEEPFVGYEERRRRGSFRSLSGSHSLHSSTTHNDDDDDDDDDHDDGVSESHEEESSAMQGLRWEMRAKKRQEEEKRETREAKSQRSGLVSSSSNNGGTTDHRLGSLFLSSLALDTIREDNTNELAGFQSSAYDRSNRDDHDHRRRGDDNDDGDDNGNGVNGKFFSSDFRGISGPDSVSRRAWNCEAIESSNAKSFKKGLSSSSSLHRAALPG